MMGANATAAAMFRHRLGGGAAILRRFSLCLRSRDLAPRGALSRGIFASSTAKKSPAVGDGGASCAS